MTRDDLITVLGRIADGTHTGTDVERARSLTRQDDRLPADLRDDVFTGDDDIADASALMALLDADPFAGLVGQAVFDAAGIDIADAVLAAIGSAVQPPVADAVRDEAGPAPEMETPDDGWAPLAAVLTEGLRNEALGIDVSAAVFAELGVATAPLAAAVHAEAGDCDIAPAVMHTLGVPALGLAAAVRATAGTVDVGDAVIEQVAPAWLCGLLDGQLDTAAHQDAAHRLMRDPALGLQLTGLASVGPVLREAIQLEAGSVSMWATVAGGIGIAEPEAVPGWDGARFAASLREQAGTVDVADAVMRRVEQADTVATPVSIPEPANSGSGWRTAIPALTLVAAAALLVVFLGSPATQGPSDSMEALQFASAGEVTIESLSYGDGVIVHVMPAEGDAPLIVWVDEEVTL